MPFPRQDPLSITQISVFFVFLRQTATMRLKDLPVSCPRVSGFGASSCLPGACSSSAVLPRVLYLHSVPVDGCYICSDISRWIASRRITAPISLISKTKRPTACVKTTTSLSLSRSLSDPLLLSTYPKHSISRRSYDSIRHIAKRKANKKQTATPKPPETISSLSRFTKTK
jgi:hypothetical protein